MKNKIVLLVAAISTHEVCASGSTGRQCDREKDARLGMVAQQQRMADTNAKVAAKNAHGDNELYTGIYKQNKYNLLNIEEIIESTNYKIYTNLDLSEVTRNQAKKSIVSLIEHNINNYSRFQTEMRETGKKYAYHRAWLTYIGQNQTIMNICKNIDSLEEYSTKDELKETTGKLQNITMLVKK